MAARARHAQARVVPIEEATPPLDDPVELHRAFRRHKRKRLARIEHRRELQRARRRFWILIGALLALALFLSVTIWEQIQSMFGI
jgi:hypothetical protein